MSRFGIKSSMMIRIIILILITITAVKAEQCVKVSEECIEINVTKDINGMQITRECWNYQSKYTCTSGTFEEDTSCNDLVNRGCSPVNQQCTENSCTNYYECPVVGDTTQEMDCTDQSTSINNYEFDTSYNNSADFGKAASSLQAIEDAVKTDMDISTSNCTENPPLSGNYECNGDITVFAGEPLGCSINKWGFSDCCKGSGWGQDMNLNSCEADEVKLGYAREGALCAYIGKYCGKKAKPFNSCISKRHTYCCYKSKLSRIVQQGAHTQLGISWGTAKIPQCRGITITEMQQVDFNQIDFTEIFSDALKNADAKPEKNAMENVVNDYINNLTGGTENAQCSQFDKSCMDEKVNK